MDEEILKALNEMDQQLSSLIKKASTILIEYTTDHIDDMIDVVSTESLSDRMDFQRQFIEIVRKHARLLFAQIGITISDYSTIRDLVTVLDVISSLPERDDFTDVLDYLDDIDLGENNTDLVADMLESITGLDVETFYNVVENVDNVFCLSIRAKAESVLQVETPISEDKINRLNALKDFLANHKDTVVYKVIDLISGKSTTPAYKYAVGFLNIGQKVENLVPDITAIYLLSDYSDPIDFYGNEIEPLFNGDPRSIIIKDEFISKLGD